MKRLLLLLCGLMSLVMSAHAADGDQFTYTYKGKTVNYSVISESEKTCRVGTNSNRYARGDLKLPENPIYNGIPYTLVEIGESAFYWCSGLTSLTIPESVTSIGNNAFRGCTGLTSVTIPESVTSIGNNAFRGCTGLTSVTIPESVTTIGKFAFYGCTGLTSVTIPESVTSISAYAFYGCTGLTSMTIPESVTSIGEGAFSSCTGLTDINVENGNKYFCSYLGVLYNYDKTSLIVLPGAKTSIDIAPTVNSIYAYAFAGCTGLTSVTIPESVTSIGAGAFAGCTGLTSVTIPNSVTTIGESVFYVCTGLTSVTIPESVTSIGNDAFNGCTGLTSVTIPESVTSIGAGAFNGCTGLTSVTIPESVTSIGKWAFAKCTGLTSVTIPESVTSISAYAFRGCTGLTSVTIPESVTTIGEEAFSGCTGLTSVTIPESVTSIGRYAFAGCTGLTSLTIPNSVTTIGDYAFRDCTGLTSLTILNSVIEKSAFSGLTNLTTVHIGDSVKTIREQAFRGCTSLTSVYIGNSVGDIYDEAFRDCTSLTSVLIGDNADSRLRIRGSAFHGCNGLKKMAYPDSRRNPINSDIAVAYPSGKCTIENGFIFDQTKTTLYFAPISLSGEYIVPSTVETIADRAFAGCKDITYIRMPASLSSIGRNAFKDCNFYEFAIPNAVKSFDMGSLSGNPLKSLTVGAGVTEISDATSSFSAGIEKILWLGDTPPVGYRDVNAVVNFVSNDRFDFEKQIIYPFLSSIFEVDGIKYVPVSASEETCNVIDYLYAPSHTAFSVPAIVTNEGIQKKVVDIGAYAFYNNDYLTEISLDNNGVIDDYAFYNCAKLESVTFGNDIPEIKNHSFEKCKALKEVESSPALTSIGEWAFAGCTAMPDVKLSDSVTSVGAYAFSGCVGMINFSVGDKITSFGEKAFSDCTGLKEFYSYATTPPVCGNEALDDINKLKCTLHVPEASKSLYASAPQWKYFLYFEFIEAGVDNILIDHNNNLEIYDLKGIRQSTSLDRLPSGMYIIRQGNKVTKIAVN